MEYNSSFIDVDGYSDGTTIFVMEHCRIENCEGTFISADGNVLGDNFNVAIKDCSVENHCGNFLMARYADKGNDTGVQIQNTTFINVTEYEKVKDSGLFASKNREFIWGNYLSLIHIDDVAFQCENNRFENIYEDVLEVNASCISSQKSHIVGCVFVDFQQDAPLTGLIKECSFTKAKKVVFGKCGEFLNTEVNVVSSSFADINGMITVSYGKIEHCHFTDSTITVEVEGKSTGKDSYCSEANDLTFTNCTAQEKKGFTSMDGPCFLQAKSYLDKPGLCVLFNGCKFENCRTIGNYINTDTKIFGAFDRIKEISVGREIGTSIK